MTNHNALQSIGDWFGPEFMSRENRLASYDMLEHFIELAHVDWTSAPNTAKIASDFAKKISTMSDNEFAFLLCHSGFIPETYAADSSQETLFSKLVEVVVGEWALRLGFDKTTLPSKKSSVEDITIRDQDCVIVSDAKTYRLGRSQKAPNVKDTLKKSDIAKWLSQYPEGERLGGLVTFPSQHDWSNGSDVYLYLTDKTSPILLLFYEHLSFISLGNGNKNNVISYFRNHSNFYPDAIDTKSGSRKYYFDILKSELLSCSDASWIEFDIVANVVIRERVSHALQKLGLHLANIREEAKLSIENIGIEQLKEELVEARVALKSQNLIRQMNNIKLFRSTLD